MFLILKDAEQRAKLLSLINNYKPIKIRETEITMKFVLKDEEPVYQSAKQLSLTEKKEVNAQIDKRIAESIVQPSTMLTQWCL